MRIGFFAKTAWSNLRKNYRFFIPRILAEAGLMGVFFIILTLKNDDRILSLRGGAYLGEFMSIGLAVLILLSTVLMIYVNSFLMKQRKREFGLYNVLGMEKRHVCRILFYENAIAGLLSTLIGLGTGILFYKLCSLLICRLLGAQVALGMDFIYGRNLLGSFGFFLILNFLTFCGNALSIARLKPVDLLSSKSAGEREPKVKWVLLIGGILALGGGYAISLTTKEPLQAILLFFLAVILVIIGTYFLFTAGSIFVLKALKKKEKYFYQKNHMVSVSGLLYRMKQNAVGLASICILSTGVLVMISTTVSLYAGAEDTLQKNYPMHDYISADYTLLDAEGNEGDTVLFSREMMEEVIYSAAEEAGLSVKTIQFQRYLEVTYRYENGRLTLPRSMGEPVSDSLAGYCSLTFITEEEYQVLGGEPLHLTDGQMAICSQDSKNLFPGDTLDFCGREIRLVPLESRFPIASRMIISFNRYGVVLPNEKAMEQIYQEQKAAYERNASSFVNQAAVLFDDLWDNYQRGYAFDDKVSDILVDAIFSSGAESFAYQGNDGVWTCKDDFMGMYTSLLFLGLILGFVCLFATVLIIYYKQISEGYEDRERFQIMQKIGMTRREIKKTVNSQVLLVFFLPLVTAGIHLAFAFPILEKILHVLLLSSTMLFVLCAAITFALFAVIYVLIYLATARTYYKIVR